MANPTDISSSNNPVVLEATTTEDDIILNADRTYRLFHDGEDTSGTGATDTIYLKFDAAGVDNDESEGDNKFKLMDGREVVIGPGVARLYFQVKSSGGSPTFSIMPGLRRFGDF